MKTPALRSKVDLAAIREKLGGTHGRQYWRSLEELADTEEFRIFLHAEFPQQASAFLSAVDRRQFLKLMGASLALAGLSACTRQPAEKIVPYVHAPEEIVPGEPLYFATALSLGGIANGVLVESHMGRPTKVEGNPEHPASLGATDLFAQASVLTLYDPDRSHVITNVGEIRPWGAFLSAIRPPMDAQREGRGAGLRILTETVTSPTLAHQLGQILKELPQAKWHQYDPANRDNARNGARLAFGDDVDTQYRIENADVILALDADFLSCGPGSVRYARDFAHKRRVEGKEASMNRLYAVEATPSNTGAMADHRLPIRAVEIEPFARAVAAGLGLPVQSGAVGDAHRKWIAALVRDLQHHQGSSLVVAGDWQPASVHALVHAMNDILGNVGRTVVYTEPIEAQPVDQGASLRDLVADMNAGRVELLLILGANPVFTAPADLRFREALDKVALRVHSSLYFDETSDLCHWHIPEAHDLERWGDARAYDGTATILQPLIAPLYGGKSAHELLATLLNHPELAGYDIVRGHWKSQHPGPDFEHFWRKAVHDGVIPRTAAPARAVSLRADWAQRVADASRSKTSGDDSAALEIVFRPDPTIFDGRFANNAWLQELPKAGTKLTWDNAALLSPSTAERLELSNEDVIELRFQGRAVRAPVWITPGHAPDSVTVHLGYGRQLSGNVGTGIGFNAYALRTTEATWFGTGLEIHKTGERYALACTQHHHSMEGRHLVRSATVEKYHRDPHFAAEEVEQPSRELSLYPNQPYEGYAWGMTIDLSSCTGCNACVVACQSENNIATVGKTQVSRGREMHWIRIDRYYSGDLDNPSTVHQPVPCMQCENAPCELVCPVNATVHSSEGLNDMVYNRCVGTRYCSNNCPYKVRRFNFFLFSDWNTESLKLQRNPDVTVRSRGVMEKCTYCVQRINYARIQSEKEDRQIRDGEIRTACQQACPAQAIVFGNINDRSSQVAKLKGDPRNYALLGDLNTRPRTTYLARLRNPNPEIGEPEDDA